VPTTATGFVGEQRSGPAALMSVEEAVAGGLRDDLRLPQLGSGSRRGRCSRAIAAPPKRDDLAGVARIGAVQSEAQ
jgi:hypothetical protein